MTPAQKFSYACGVGGFGAVFDANNWANTPNTPGAEGTKTTFGSLDSSTGSTSDIGYTDPVTGEVFAAKGEQGIAGGDGAGMNPNHGSKDRFVPLQSTSVVDEDGQVWKGGNTRLGEGGLVEAAAGDEQSFTGGLEDGYCGGAVSYNCGSGAAAGANGTPGNTAGTFRLVSVPSRGMPKTSITVTARGSASVPGANATLVPRKPAAYGKGGRGGYGGGGDGATGISQTYYGGSKSGTLNNYPGSVRTRRPRRRWLYYPVLPQAEAGAVRRIENKRWPRPAGRPRPQNDRIRRCAMPNDYYTMIFTGEKVDELLKRVDDGEIIIPSSTTGSTKKFKLTVDDTGTVSATEVTS